MDQHCHNEFRWWNSKGINPWTLALTLHSLSGDNEAALMAIERHRLR